MMWWSRACRLRNTGEQAHPRRARRWFAARMVRPWLFLYSPIQPLLLLERLYESPPSSSPLAIRRETPPLPLPRQHMEKHLQYNTCSLVICLIHAGFYQPLWHYKVRSLNLICPVYQEIIGIKKAPVTRHCIKCRRRTDRIFLCSCCAVLPKIFECNISVRARK